MIRVADFIIKFLADYGVKNIFMVVGGGAMHLNDAIGKNKQIKYICNLHEQACTMAAEGYARVTGKMGVVCVSSGPGGTNTVTGVMGAWVDSIPMLVISGQVKLETTILKCPGLRQLGDQEINITDIVRPVTKYSVVITNKNEVKYHLDKAIFLATTGRPGPVWLDIPLDIQGATINETELKLFDPAEIKPFFDKKAAEKKIDALIEKIKTSKRPVIMAGNGVILANARNNFEKVTNKLQIPILTAISGIDLIHSDSPLSFGRPGVLGERPANFIIQNADLVIIVGTRMNLRQIGYAYDLFAREAFKAAIDIDKYELRKPTLKLDMPIHCDVKFFLELMEQKLSDCNWKNPDINDWLEYCRKIKQKYPVVQEKHRNNNQYVNSYYFAELLSKYLKNNALIVTGNGTAYTSTFQVFKIKPEQRMFANVGCASMGYDLPAAIGGCLGANNSETICITGDGSIQMNIQELQTIQNYNLPIKIFMFNNHGYLSIKITQKTFFDGHFVGSTPQSGIKLPNMTKIAQAYGYKTITINNNRELEKKLPEIMELQGTFFCELMLDPFEELEPKASSTKQNDGKIVSRPIEDLAPFLPRDEFQKNMLIRPI
jgi:acetolactate synthase-1/2/3 large subunit